MISVIIPVYKVEKYLSRCIESVIGQTYTNLEIILVDDGSPDKCPLIIDEYAKNDKRIKVIYKENGGLSSARNAGLEIATGDYITFVDSDDTIDCKMYEILYNLLKKHNSDIAICQLVRVSEDVEGNLIIPNLNIDNIEEKIFTRAEALKQIMINGDIGNFACTKLFKRELFNEVLFPDGKVYEDIATIYKLVHKANKIIYTNQKLYYYLYGRVGAITSSFSEKKILDSIYAYFTQYRFITENYPEIKQYANITWVKMYTSAMEKICMNNYNELWNSKEVIEKYDYFIKAIDTLDEKVLQEYFEPYRLISAVLLRHNREIYKGMFPIIFEKIKNATK